jgi:predicted P-loop ATPase
LQGLQWDGVERLNRWLSAHLGAADTEYSRAVGSRWLISAVARIFQPSAKADCCLILEGPQGIRKSTALRTLAGEYFTDELADLGSNDAAMQTRGVWIIELSELDGLSNSDVARIKAFMSRTTDRFRPPYGMRLVRVTTAMCLCRYSQSPHLPPGRDWRPTFLARDLYSNRD